MTKAVSEKQKKIAQTLSLKTWLMGASPTEYILAFAAVASSIIAFLQYSITKADIERAATKTLMQVEQKTTAAAVQTETFLRDELNQTEMNRDQSQAPNTNLGEQEQIGFVVQLASYQSDNCDRAQRAANRYASGFKSKPKLYSSPSSLYVVVAVPAKTKEAALEVVLQAKLLSETDQFKDEDFRNARIRENPDWKVIPDCTNT